VVATGTTRGGPNVQAPIGNLVAQRLGSAWAGSGPFALNNPLYRKRFGEISGGAKKNIGPGPLGPLGITGEGWAQNKNNGQTGFDELQNLVDTQGNVNAGLGLVNQRIGGQGAGFGVPGGYLRRLLLQNGGAY
jgi:hypothetical protein